MKLCTCLNCGNVYEDMNPGRDSIDYPDELLDDFFIPELPTITLNDGDIGYGCPECKTDGYLQDNIQPDAGGMAEILDLLFTNF